LAKAAQNLSGAVAWLNTNSTERSGASAGAAAEPEVELDFPAIVSRAQA